MDYYPIFVDLKNQPCLIVGAGEVAHRKIRLMLTAGAKITVIAPEICQELDQECGAKINYLQREFVDQDIQGYRLITAATNNAKLNQHISKLAKASNVPVNVVDAPEHCSYITPSIVDRSPVTIAISTGGSAPVLARLLRSKLEAFIPASYGRLAETMQRYRQQVKNQFPEQTPRRRFWENIVQGPISELFFSGQHKQAETQLQSEIERADAPTPSGAAWLIGAGPGDPDLLTFRALRLMQQADVVLYDRLVSEEVLNLTRRDAKRIYVGKKRADHAVPQPEINQLIVDLAQQGNRVVRLKGGDPFIFGRGGEEIDLLAKTGIPFQIVPGISAANGCAAYAGIPLTHRNYAQSCLFVTGHLKDNSVDLDWTSLATENQTVVIYMGLEGLRVVCEKLIEHGVSADMPIALIEQGTTQHQRVFISTLAKMPETINKQDVHAPTLIIVGEVVSLHKELNWYLPQPE